MRDLTHVVSPLRIFQGGECLGQLTRELERHGSRRAVVFCGRTLGRAGSPLGLVKAALGERCAGVFDGVAAHSLLPAVEAGAAALREHRADAVVAVGGGSAIVTARASSVLLAEPHDIRQLATSRDPSGRLVSPKLMAPKLPQLVVPTTPTTAMVKAGSAVFDPGAGTRLALFDPKTRAGALFLHPAFLTSAPPELLVSAGLNTLTGAIEGLMSRAGDPISDALLMHAVRLLARHLPARDRHDEADLRAELMFAAILAGRGTDQTSTGIIATLGHAIGVRCHVENGIANAVVLPHALRFNAEASPAGLDKLATALGLPLGAGGTAVEGIVDALAAITTALGVPRRLRDIGVTTAHLPVVAEHAMGDWFLRQNPRPVRHAAELMSLLEAAW